ncbi:MAG: HlyC/CorC family transporter [Candidatus Rokubacteria bacterium]|nr:HlyC/CorC family transporter [Candidatus Rokubacteria bacterium]
MTLVSFVIATLIGVNAFYVLAEFAAVSVRQTQLRPLADRGNRLAGRLLPVVSSPRRLDLYIATCQIGITFSSLALGAYSQATITLALAPRLEAWGLGAVTAVSAAAIAVLLGLTTLQMVFGELVPKSLALQFPVRSALYTYWPMHLTMVLFSWAIGMLNGSGLAIMRLLRVPESSHRHIHSPEEIDLLIAESTERGVLEREDQQRLRRALRLGVRTARELMVPRPRIVAVDADAPLPAVLRQIAENPYTRLPVYRGTLDAVVGMVHTRELVARYVERGGLDTIDEVLQPVLSIPEALRVDRLLAQMREHRTQLALVVDEFGGVAGLVTVQDVLQAILGEVSAEARAGRPPIERLPDGRVRVPGLMRVHEAEPWLGVLWNGDAVTVAGQVIEALGRFPFRGERTVIDGVEVEVEEVRGRTIVSILARPAARSGTDP